MRVHIKKQTAPLITRFAPSPTGYLHLGHIVSMAFVYGIAKAAKASILLRIEDHDRGRCRPEFEQAIYEDLKWLGFVFDSQPTLGNPSPLRQSDRTSRYQELTDELMRSQAVYRCICTRSQIQERTKNIETGATPEELYYDGACRTAATSPTQESGLRLRVPDQGFTFDDGILGIQSQNPQTQCGDFLIKDRHDNFTYQFAVTVDDWDQQVNLVVRGSDLLHATGRQLFLSETLGRKDRAQYLHHPLVTDEAGKKLSKRFFSEAVAKKRAEGINPDQLLGQALAAVGLIKHSASPTPIKPSELEELFEVRIVP